MTMSVYLIFPDLGNTKIAHFRSFEPSNTMRAVFKLCSCEVCVCVCVVGKGWGGAMVDRNCCKSNIFCRERVSSGSLLVDVSSLDISSDDLLPTHREG